MKPKRSSLVVQLTVHLGILAFLLLAIFAIADYQAQKQRIFRSTVTRMNELARVLRMCLTEGNDPKEWESSIRSFCHLMSRSGVTNHQYNEISEIHDMFNEMVRRLEVHEKRVMEEEKQSEHIKVLEEVGHRLSGRVEQLNIKVERLSSCLPGNTVSQQSLAAAQAEMEAIFGELQNISMECELLKKVSKKKKAHAEEGEHKPKVGPS